MIKTETVPAPIWKDTYLYAILESDETNKLCRESVETER